MPEDLKKNLNGTLMYLRKTSKMPLKHWCIAGKMHVKLKALFLNYFREGYVLFLRKKMSKKNKTPNNVTVYAKFLALSAFKGTNEPETLICRTG